MYKTNLYLNSLILCFLLLLVFSCSKKDDTNVELPKAPTNINLTISLLGADPENIYGDGSGKITISATATDATSYTFELGNGFEQVLSSGDYTYTYTTLGTHNYNIKVTASNVSGFISATKQISILYDPYLSIKNLLSNTSSKVWYWDQTQSAHLGESPLSNSQPTINIADPNEFVSVGCLYDDVITFTKESNGDITLVLDNNGSTYFNKDEVFDALGSQNTDQDDCYNYSTNNPKTLTFSNSVSGILNSTKIDFTISNNGFMSYYLGTSTYEILSITDTEMHLRIIQDVDGVQTAWYQKFTTTQPPEVIDFSQLIWADEFNTAGAPNSSNWGYDIGTGSGGWGNNELQYYTNRSDNVKVENGKLIITAKKESYGGMGYTSARLLSQNKFSFKYGRVEVSAKLPGGIGIWPAIWMLGDNFTSVGWPACGEIDIMEYVGYEPTKVHATVHTTAGSGGNGSGASTTVSDCETNFHVYAIEWDSEKIKFFVDDILYYTYQPTTYITSTWPFSENFFFILNVAVGGNWGGLQGVDDSIFPQSMEIDYVRVYQ